MYTYVYEKILSQSSYEIIMFAAFSHLLAYIWEHAHIPLFTINAQDPQSYVHKLIKNYQASLSLCSLMSGDTNF